MEEKFMMRLDEKDVDWSKEKVREEEIESISSRRKRRYKDLSKDVDWSKEKVREEEIESISSRRKRGYKDLSKWNLWDAILPHSEWLHSHLEVGFWRRKKVVEKLIVEIKSKDSLEKVKCMASLSQIVLQDPRMCDDLQYDFLFHLVGFLKDQETPKVKIRSAIILRVVLSFSDKNRETLAELIDAPLLMELISSESDGVKMQGLILFRTMTLAIPKHYKSIPVEVIESLIYMARKECYFSNEITDSDVGITDSDSNADSDLLPIISLTLSAVCQEFPELPVEMLESAVSALACLINNDDEEVVQSVCIGLVHLHNGNRKFLLTQDQLKAFERLVDIINNGDRDLMISALEAVGSILRWCDDADTENMLLFNVLPALGSKLYQYENDMGVLPLVCWVISIVTASKEEHIEAVINHQLIDLVVNIVENPHFEVKSEAVWAISNAILGASSDGVIKYLSERCINPLLNLLDCSDWQIVILCLEDLVKLQAVKVSYCGEVIDDAAGFAKLNNLINGETFRPLKKSQGYDENSDGLLVIPTYSSGHEESSWRSGD